MTTAHPFHPKTASKRKKQTGKLSLPDAISMAVGGMIGGGIFSVLGVTVALAGHLAVACFIVGGIIALMTAHSFALLSSNAGKSGGLFIFLRNCGYPKTGAFLSWFLIFGYVVALAVYSFTFGHYAAHVLGVGSLFARIFSVGITFIFFAINIKGVSTSAITENIIVGIKILILAVISTIGFFHFTSSRFTPLANNGISNILIGATTIFVAYEGFELLSYDYDDLENPKRNMRRALYISVLTVIAVYVIVTIGSQLLLDDATIVSQKEVAFASVGQSALGIFGKWLATFAALLATCSAINATLFSSARQMREISTKKELPAVFEKSHHDIPINSLALLSIFSAGFSLLPGITELLTFGSAIFLLVFAITNFLAFKISKSWQQKVIGFTAFMACTIALLTLFIQLALHDRSTLLLIAICVLTVSFARIIFMFKTNHL